MDTERTIYPKGHTVTSLYQQRVKERANLTCLYWIDEKNEISNTLTYSQLHVRAQKVAWYLQNKLGVGFQEPVILCYPPGFMEFVTSFLGCGYCEAISVPICPISLQNPKKDSKRVSLLVKDCGAKVLLTSKPYTTFLRTVIPTFQDPILSNLTILSDEDIMNETKHVDEETLAKYPIATKLSTIFMLQYTSGSTGNPKGVMLSHANILHQCYFASKDYSFGDGYKALNTLPQYHDFGCIGYGLDLLLYDDYIQLYTSSVLEYVKDPQRLLLQLSKFKIQTLGSPPFMALLAARKMSPEVASTIDLSHLESWVFGGEPLTYKRFCKILKHYEAFNVKPQVFCPGYGMAEHTFSMTKRRGRTPGVPNCICINHKKLEKHNGGHAEIVSPNHEHAYWLVTAGTINREEVTVRIVNTDNHIALKEGMVGEVWVDSGSKGMGYYNKTAETESVFCNRLPGDPRMYLRTGDLGFIYQDDLYIIGRLKDILIVRGRNISPQDLEQTVEEAHPKIRKGCTVAFSSPKSGREHIVLIAEVYGSQSSYWLQPWKLFYDYLYPENLGEVITAIVQSVQEVHNISPDEVLLVAPRSIPKTTSGKLQRSQAKEMYSKNEWKPHIFSSYLRKKLTHSQEEELPNLATETNVNVNKQEQAEETPVVVTVDQVLELVTNYLKKELNLQAVDVNQTISSYGVDSIKTLQLIRELESTIQRRVRLTGLTTAFTLSQFADHVVNHSDPITKTISDMSEIYEAHSFAGFPYVFGLGTTLPKYSVTTQGWFQFYTNIVKLSDEKYKRFEKITNNCQIDRRYSVADLPELEKVLTMTTHERNLIYMDNAPVMACNAARKAIADWGGNPLDITHVISVSTTGVIVPDLSFQVVKTLGLNQRVQRENILYMGCFGCLSGIRTAKAIASESPKNRVLLVCTELCTVHIQEDDRDDFLVGGTIFGDGAGAMVLGPVPRPGERAHFQIVKSESRYIPNTEEHISWLDSNKGFIVGLSPDVPGEIFGHIEPFMHDLMPDQEVWKKSVWAIHPGGAAILRAIEAKMGLKAPQTKQSWDVLRAHGNMSSATLCFIMTAIKEQKENLKEFDHIIGLAFGPGINIEGTYWKIIH